MANYRNIVDAALNQALLRVWLGAKFVGALLKKRYWSSKLGNLVGLGCCFLPPPFNCKLNFYS